jgi:hypothetical protein
MMGVVGCRSGGCGGLDELSMTYIDWGVARAGLPSKASKKYRKSGGSCAQNFGGEVLGPCRQTAMKKA